MKNALTLLVNYDPIENTESLIQSLRNENTDVNVVALSATETLESQLTAHPIDAILTQWENAHDSAEKLIAQLKQMKKIIPTFLLVETYQAEWIQRGLAIGAQDVIVMDSPHHLACAITREVNYLKSRRMNLQLNQRLTDISGRYKNLLNQTKNSTDQSNGSYQQQLMLIEQAFKKITPLTDENFHHYVLYLAINAFDDLIHRVGFQEIQMVIGTIQQLITKQLPNTAPLFAFNERGFVTFLSNSNEENVTALTRSLLNSITEHLCETKNHTLQLALRIGIVEYDQHEGNAIDLISRAFSAAHEITLNRNTTEQFQFFKSGSTLKKADAKKSEEYLQNAIFKNQLRIVFQPIVGLNGNEQEMYEALLRIIDDNGNEVSRETFFNMVETANFFEQLDRWIITQALQALAQRLTEVQNTHLFIHVSSASLSNPEFPAWLSGLLLEAKINTNLLTLQINETDAAQYLRQATQLTRDVRQLGYNIAISQFKGAESSMSLLPHLYANMVKLDVRFTHTLLETAQNRKDLSALITALHEKKIKVIATQIEGARVLAPLWQSQVDYLQGYYFQPPQPEMNYAFNQDR